MNIHLQNTQTWSASTGSNMDSSQLQYASEARSENLRRVGRRLQPPARRCRRLTDQFVMEHTLEEVEEDRKEVDQRTLRLKEKNKR